MANQSTTSLKLSDCTNVFHNRSIMGKNGNLTPNLSIENATVLSDNSAVSESQVLNNKSFVERVRQVSNLSGLSLFFPKGSLNDTKLKMKSKKCSDNSLSLTQVLQKLEESSDVTPPPELKNNKGCKVSITFEKSSKDKEEDSLQISDQLDEISTRFEKSERRKKPKANKVSINFDCRSQTPSISNDSLTMPSIGNSANVSERTRRSTRNKSSVSINYDVSSQTLETSNESKVVSDKEKSINARTRKSSRKKHSLLNGITEKEANVPVNVEKITKEVLEEQSNEPLSEKTEGFGENIKGAASNDGSHMEASTEELMTTERVAVDGTEKPESQTEMEVDNPQNKDDSCKDNNNLSVSEEIKGVDVRSQNEVGISNSEENNPAMPNSLTDSSPSKDTEEQMGKANQENNIILGSNGPEGQVIPSESPKENLSQNTIVAKKIKDALKKSSRIPKLKRLQSKKFISGNSQKVENTREKSEVNCNKTDLIKDIKEQDCITSETKTNTQEIPLETESLAENNSGGNDISQKDSIDSLVSGSELSLKRYSTQVESKSKIRQHCSVHVNVYFESTKSITTTSFTVPSKTSSECSPMENNACRSGSAEDNKSDEDNTINSLPTGSELSLNGNSTAAGSKLKRVKQHCSVHVDFESTNGLTTTSLTMTPKPILQESADDTAEKSECVIGSALKAPTNDGEIEKEINGSLLSGSKLSEPEKSTGTESKAIAENSDCRKDSLVKRTVECREASKEVPVLDSTSMAPSADSADTPNINKLSENKTETKVGKILNSTYNVDSQIHTPLGGSEENQTTQNKELVLPLNPANKLDLPPSAIQASDKSDTFALVKPTDECKEDGQTVKTLPVLDSTSMAPSADSADTPNINKLSENKTETKVGKILNSTYNVDSQIHTPLGGSEENQTTQNKELVLPLNPANKLDLPPSAIQASDKSDTFALVKPTDECKEDGQTVKTLPVLDSTSMAPSADSADTPNINKLSENKTETKVGKILNSTYNVDSQIHTPLGGSEENQTTQNKELVLPLNPANKLDLPPSAIQASDKSDTFALVKPTDECKEDGQTVKTLPVLDSTSMAPCADSAKIPSINKLSENKIETNFGKILNSTYTVDSQIHTPFGESDENQNKELVLPLNPPMLGLPSSTIQASDVSDTYGDQNRNQDREFGVLRRDSHCGEITINETPMENVFDARGSNAHFAVSRPGRVSEFDLSMTMGVSVISSEPGVNQGGGKGHSTPISQFSLSNEQQDQSKEEMNESENVVFAHPHPPLRRSLRASLGKRSLGQSDIENVSKRRKLDKTGIETTVGTFLNMRDVPQSTPKPEHDEDSQSTTRSTRRSSLAMENKKNQVIQVSKSIFGSSTDSSSRTYSKKRRTNDLPPISSPKEPPGKKVNKSPQFIQLKKTSTKSVCFMDIPSYSLSQSSRKSSPYSLRGNNSRMHISRKVSSTSRVQSWSSSSTEGSNVTSERGSRYKQHTVHFRNYSSHIDFSETDLSGGMTQSSKENSKVPSLVGNDSNPKNQSDSEEDLSSQNQSNKGDLLRQKRFQPRKTEIKNSENSIQQEPASEYRSEIGESISRIETVAERSAQYEASGLNTSVPSSDYSISTTILDPMNILTGRQEEAKGMKQRPMITLPLNLRSVKGKKEKFDYKNNPAFMINGQPYEPPKSKLFEKWVHPKMLMFITSQLQKHYLNHDCILLDRRIVGYVCSTVSAVSKLQQDSDIATATIVLRNILSHYKICSNVLEYYLFIRSYTPFDFQRKALSLKGFIKDKKLGDPLVSENEKLNIDLLDQND